MGRVTPRAVGSYLRGALWAARIRSRGGSVGRRLRVGRGSTLMHPASDRIVIGNDVYLGVGVIVSVMPGAALHLDDGVRIMHYSLLAAQASITVGAGTQVAEHASVRDMDHGTHAGVLMKSQPLVSTPVHIADDVWIGRGVAVLRGARIERGAVVGANAVVRGDIPSEAIAVGAPARVVKYRQE